MRYIHPEVYFCRRSNVYLFSLLHVQFSSSRDSSPGKISMRNKGESADLLNCMLKHSRTSVGLFQMKEHREKKKQKQNETLEIILLRGSD